ncbi:M42 family metallopeptidase [Irregularibacter muris]|uniref:M42 family metallopeptidase n=1 Tax=Irregularibacter muris TaxID=1796619 RepID=A0AAE3KZ40_9FIRM|nr:M42 family metallopeptidase [Irregularibacter muris]MCR1898066.1 M42 family metallopeptidase [Irregularibacter muris]
MLLKKLTESSGVSGNEQEVRALIIQEIKDKVDHIQIDNLGNVIAYKKGKGNVNKKVMLCAHMDEVGLIITSIESDGLLKFKPVGGIDPRILVSKVVNIGENKIPGVIGAKAIHLQEPKEREKALKVSELYIDIGATSKEEAEKIIDLGDYATFHSKYIEFGDGLIKAKALDDRVGCAIITQMLDEDYDFTLYAVFTVQEEVGLRGAGVAAFDVDPDIALVIEGTTCSDVPGTAEHEYATKLGHGPAISIMDMASYSDKNISRMLYELGKSNNIPVQYKKTTFGGNDAGAIHLTKEGIRTGAISIPCRYIHSPSSVMSLNDYKGCRDIVRFFLEHIEKGEI